MNPVFTGVAEPEERAGNDQRSRFRNSLLLRPFDGHVLEQLRHRRNTNVRR